MELLWDLTDSLEKYHPNVRFGCSIACDPQADKGKATAIRKKWRVYNLFNQGKLRRICVGIEFQIKLRSNV